MNLTILSLEKFFFDPIKLGVILVVCSIIGCLIFVKLFTLSDSCWKKTEVILFFFSALGIGGMVGSNRHFFYEREQRAIGYRIDTYIHYFNSELNPERYNHSFSTTLYSPEDIQEVEDDYKTMYLWMLENSPKLIQHVYERKAINLDSMVFPQILAEELLREDVENWKMLIFEYNKLIDEYQYYAYNKGANGFEFYYNILYPVFFVLGLSYSIVRYVGEYCNSKKEEVNTANSQRQIRNVLHRLAKRSNCASKH